MTYPADLPDAPKAPPTRRFPLDEDDEPEIIIDISPGDELVDDDDLDDELERGFRNAVNYEIDDEPTGPRRAS